MSTRVPGVNWIQSGMKSEGGEEKRSKENTKKENIKQAKQKERKGRFFCSFFGFFCFVFLGFFLLQSLACSCHSKLLWVGLEPEKPLHLDITCVLYC